MTLRLRWRKRRQTRERRSCSSFRCVQRRGTCLCVVQTRVSWAATRPFCPRVCVGLRTCVIHHACVAHDGRRNTRSRTCNYYTHTHTHTHARTQAATAPLGVDRRYITTKREAEAAILGTHAIPGTDGPLRSAVFRPGIAPAQTTCRFILGGRVSLSLSLSLCVCVCVCARAPVYPHKTKIGKGSTSYNCSLTVAHVSAMQGSCTQKTNQPRLFWALRC